MKQYPGDFPSTNVPFREAKDPAIQGAVRFVLSIIEQMRARISDVVNTNTITFVADNSQPTVPDGQAVLWRDADAASGQPSHYLIFQDGATTIKWAGDHLVP